MSGGQEGLDAARAAMRKLINDDVYIESKYVQHFDMCESIFEAVKDRNFVDMLKLVRTVCVCVELFACWTI